MQFEWLQKPDPACQWFELPISFFNWTRCLPKRLWYALQTLVRVAFNLLPCHGYMILLKYSLQIKCCTENLTERGSASCARLSHAKAKKRRGHVAKSCYMPLIPKKRISDQQVNLNQGICARNGISDAKPFQSPFLNKTPTKRPSRYTHYWVFEVVVGQQGALYDRIGMPKFPFDSGDSRAGDGYEV